MTSSFRRARIAALAFVAALAAILAAAPATADVRCTAVAVRANGDVIDVTRSVEVRPFERRACGAAILECERRLDGVRFETGRRLPYARCEVLRVVEVRPAIVDRYRYEDGYRFDDGAYCNYAACEHRYRSFRASDCSFQPYHGPRQRCTL